MNLETQIEAVLFYKNEPVSLKELARILDKGEEEIKEGIHKLKENLNHRGLTLIESVEENNQNFSLTTSNEVSEVIEKIAKEELSKDLGKASLETLSIILYKGPIARREIDYIRGVNSNFILRSLTMRGLIEKVENKGDGRSYLYNGTIGLLANLGLKSKESLPEFEKVRKEVEAINRANQENA